MDLINRIKNMAGGTHYAAGYELPIGNDGIVRNVPLEAADEMLTNREVWSIHDGEAPPEKGIISRRLGQPNRPMLIPSVQTIEVCHTPKSLAALEAMEPDVLLQIADMFGLALDHGAGRGVWARAILGAADEQLLMQIHEMAATARPVVPVPAALTPAAEMPTVAATPEVEKASMPITSSEMDI